MNRRTFLSAAGLAPLLCDPLTGKIAVLGPAGLAKGFLNPPDSARMWTWWFWLADNVDKQSITVDLEELKAKGVGGVTVYSLSGPGVEPGMRGPYDYMSAPWRELFKHTVQEADRLGLGVSTMLCSGWDAGGPWITPQHACKKYVHSELLVDGPGPVRSPVPQPAADARLYRDAAVLAFRVLAGGEVDALFAYKTLKESFGKSGTTPIREICDEVLKPLPGGGKSVDPASVVDLTAKMRPDGTIDWEAPAGKWAIVRLGYTLTGKSTSWSSPTGEGLECDPFDAEAMDAQFKNIGAVLVKDAGTAAGRVFRSVQIDSWETGLPNWTPRFAELFRKYRGYDPQPYLPALAGWTTGSAALTDRFLHDYRRTLGDAISDNYFGRLNELAKAAGIIQQSEAAGPCYPVVMAMDALKNLGRCDIPMGEFWQDGAWTENGQNTNGKQTACAAHLYGKRIAAAEGFASFRHWAESPALLKPTADTAFCEGTNHIFIYSSATHSGDAVPGTEFAAGTHFNRKVTWWKEARSFTDYIARCSHLLQQGLFVADVLFYNGDNCPNFVAPKHVEPSLGVGYDYDACNSEVVLTRLSVRDGRIVLPDGMSYRVLVLPERATMPEEVLQKLKALVSDGMTLIGPPPSETPGLADYPACDGRVKQAAAELWGNCDGKTVREHTFGKGRVVWGMTPREVLNRMSVAPDFEHTGAGFIDWIHRSVGSTEIYFLANRKDQSVEVACTFRVSGKRPEIWNPATGEMVTAGAFSQSGGRTSMPLEFAPYGSLFLIFEKSISDSARGTATSNATASVPLLTVAGPWAVRFDPKWGGPASAEFAHLESWTARPEEGIRYYSGAASYKTTFHVDAKPKGKVFLDLGDVKEIAHVRLNGQDLGTAWTKPFRLDASKAVRGGENSLEVEVINLWPNRLIGDGQKPQDQRLTATNVDVYTKPSPEGHKLLDSGLLGPVRLMTNGPAA
jgi:hypothetical protein